MLTAYQTYLIFPITGAVLGAMLWLSYLKKIDILEHERPIDIIIAFFIGFILPSFALYIYLFLEILGINFNGNVINDFFYSILGVGLTEELVKVLGVLIAFKVLKKQITEPVDYLIFGSIVALGFSIRENFIYYNNYGSQIITGRTLISCLTHIINTSICVYGLYRAQIFHKGNKYINAVVGISTAVISHGLFDFFLTQPIIGPLTPFLATLIYLIGINFWIQMINNCINFSPFFNYEKVSKATGLYKSVVIWYLAILLLEFTYAFYYRNFEYAVIDVLKNIFKEGILILIVALRISRLKISKRKYFPIKIQLPLHYTKNEDEDFRFFGIPIKIRGENEKEFQFLKYMGQDIFIYDVKPNTQNSKRGKRARLLKKYFLKNDVVTYLIEVYNEDKESDIYLLKPKTRAITYIDNEYPIASLMKYENPAIFQKEHETLSYKELKLIKYVYIK